MNTAISHGTFMRGADGRLYAMTANGVAEVAEAGATPARAALRAGDRVGFDAVDQEAGRFQITPGM